ncbi:inositol 5-phosphatase [Biscogniauxia marginata]|nr:inositol 5-phosphatase [Biscogniauxia marginata]
MAELTNMETNPTLDVFILTFNAAKNQINSSVFANHLYNALGQDATSLPDLLVFCIQEMAPLAKAFIGSYVLNPYFQSFESAVNLAAAKFIAEEERQTRYKDRPYTLMNTRNVGMTGIMLFAREPDAVHDLRGAEVGFGAGDMANKGAVGLRIFYKKDVGGDVRETELTFVSAHLAAMEWNLEKRNKNWESIVSGLVFEDPKSVIPPESSLPTPHTPEDGEEGQALLKPDSSRRALHEISIYKPGTHLFVAGDLNYRLSKTSPTNDSTFPDTDPESPYYYAHFLARDQLVSEKSAGRTLHGLSEAKIDFPPTYKLIVSPKALPGTGPRHPSEEEGNDVDHVNWTWAPHRWPGWCDRVLYLELPWWAQSSPGEGKGMKVRAYDAIPVVRTSDHRAVFLRLDVPVLEPSKLVPDEWAYETELNLEREKAPDPRIKLPFPIDLQSWEHRAQVKKWESIIGWSMLVSQSKQGITVLVTVLFVGLGAWWFRSQ